MHGELDNVTIQEGRILLDSVAGRHVLFGCYTSPAVVLPEFDRLVMSWNASTPEGTVVEAQARVLVDGNWTMWSTFGKWSPLLSTRANAKRPQRGPVAVEENILRLDSKTAFQAQLRIYLYTDSETRTPEVRLLGASVRPVAPGALEAPGRPVRRELRVPAYSQLLRNPSFGGAVSLPVCLAGMMNRWGEDVLPEELAHAMYDWADRSCANLPFASAVAGCWGYESYAVWTDLAHLRQELREGFAAAVELRFAPPGEEGPQCPPILADMGEREHHFITVTGFTVEDGREYVLVNEPLAPDDRTVPRRWVLDYFLSVWSGLALLVHRRRKGDGWNKPGRTAMTLKPAPRPGRPNRWVLVVKGETVTLPDDFCGSPGVPRGTLAVVKNGETVHATTAHKHFRFLDVCQGGVVLENTGRKSARYGIYAIDAAGRMLVGEVRL